MEFFFFRLFKVLKSDIYKFQLEGRIQADTWFEPRKCLKYAMVYQPHYSANQYG